MTEVASINSPPSEVSTTVSDAPPTHYTVEIESFSLLAKNNLERYESGVFEAGGYKWKLVLYPNGKKNKNVKDHVSAYLAMADTSPLPLGWEVYATFRLFLLDQNRDTYLIRQDAAAKERRFHGLKLEWGFDQFIPLRTLNDASNGYLLEDTCVFGAEVFVRKERCTGKGERLSMLKVPINYKHTWKIDNFTKLEAEHIDSEIFSLGGHKWKIKLSPKGKGLGKGTHLSLNLVLEDPTTLAPLSKRICVDFSLRVMDQAKDRGAHLVGKAKSWFSATDPESGWDRYISLDHFHRPHNALLWKDICIVETELNLIGVAGAFK